MTVDLLFDARHIRASGIGIYTREQLRCLGQWAERNRLRVAVLGQPGELDSADSNLEIVPSEPRRAPMYSLREQIILAEVHNRLRPKAFWTPHYPFPILAKKANVFVTIHDVLHALPKSAGGAGSIRGTYARSMLRTSLHRSLGVFVPSESTKSEVSRLFGASSNLHVAPMRIDRAWLDNGSTTEKPARLPSDYVLFVGNVKKHKNLLGLLEAFAKIQHRTNADLVLAGGAADVKNQDNEVLQRLSILDSRVHLMGNLSFSDLRTVVAGARCLVMPSLYEGVGLPPLEAMAVGTPVLASVIPSLRETCGEAARYFDPTDTDSMAEAMVALLDSPELGASLSQKGRDHVGERESSIDPLLPLRIIADRCL